MKILSVSIDVPYPPDDGTRARGWHLLRGLGLTDEVTCMTWTLDGPNPPPALTGAVGRVVSAPVVPIGLGRVERAARWVRALSGAPAPWVQAVREARPEDGGDPRRRAVELHRAAPFDVVVAESDAAVYLLPPIDAPVVVHRHNVFVRLLDGLSTGVRRLVWPIEARLWARLDADAARADLLVATTEESAALLRDRFSVPVRVVPNGVEVPERPLDPSSGIDAAFVGNLGYAPNLQALEWFVRRVWPDVVRGHPGVVLRVIGAASARSAPALERMAGPNVRIVGWVPRLDDALEGVRLGVVPLQTGMGIKNKTLDFLARGLPVVSTPVGAEGLGRLGGAGPIVASAGRTFGAEVSRLLADPTGACAMGAAGRRAVSEGFGWEEQVNLYRQCLVEVTAR